MASDQKFDVAALCSILCPGLGQVVKGQFAKAFAFFAASLMCFPIFWPWSVIDAYNHDPAAQALPAGATGQSAPAARPDEAPVSTGAYKVLGLTLVIASLAFAALVANDVVPLWLWWTGLFPAAFGGTMIYQAFQVEVRNRQERERARVMRVEREILQLARKTGGRVTSVDVATNCGASLDEAREMLDRMAKKGHVGVQVTDEGVFVYRVFDLPASDSKLLESARLADAASPPLPDPTAPEARPEPRKDSRAAQDPAGGPQGPPANA